MAVLSEWGNYPEMYIWRFEAPQTHRGMRFTLELQELIRVGINDIGELPASQLSGPAVGRSGEVQRGRVQLLTDAHPVSLNSNLGGSQACWKQSP